MCKQQLLLLNRFGRLAALGIHSLKELINESYYPRDDRGSSKLHLKFYSDVMEISSVINTLLILMLKLTMNQNFLRATGSCYSMVNCQLRKLE